MKRLRLRRLLRVSHDGTFSTSRNLAIFQVVRERLTLTTCERASGFSSCGLPMCQTVCVCACGVYVSFCLHVVKEDPSVTTLASRPLGFRIDVWLCRSSADGICLQSRFAFLTTESFHAAIIFLHNTWLYERDPCNEETTDLGRNSSVL